MGTLAIALAVFSLSLAIGGCGNVRLEDDDGAGGATANGDTASSATSHPSSGSGSQSGEPSASSSTGPNTEICGDFCSKVGSCINNCHGACTGYQLAPCEAQGIAVVTCITQTFVPETCAPPEGACANEFAALMACRSTQPQQCVSGGGGGNNTSCSVSQICAGGEEKVICNAEGDAMACSCFLNSIAVSTCQAPLRSGHGGIPASCSLDTSCCNFGTWP